MAGKCDKQFC